MRLSIVEADGECHVWGHWHEGDPRDLSESFILGVGETRQEAITSAVRDLEAALELLQSPPGVITEYHGRT